MARPGPRATAIGALHAHTFSGPDSRIIPLKRAPENADGTNETNEPGLTDFEACGLTQLMHQAKQKATTCGRPHDTKAATREIDTATAMKRMHPLALSEVGTVTPSHVTRITQIDHHTIKSGQGQPPGYNTSLGCLVSVSACANVGQLYY